MNSLHLKIITPRKVAIEEEVSSVTVPSADGEITVLPKHMNLLSLLNEGIITIRKDKKEDFLAIGGGYIEVDGKNVQILVSRAYNQDEINEELTEKALKEAKKRMEGAKDRSERMEASSLLRRSIIDLKLLKKRRKAPSSS